ncbi:hypothetical protein C2857_003633 [Epichloe festucae Fl1]|uniref:Fatty acid hydroxylase domain-containing protein n=1 Tax=Epichloe festucae (strain Fl1) TaxID=877507 RepID=A0A7S9PS27_EPIFF|nr:hypothetical protein C2857_003633 [Epichloe festucae Fl1]
MGRAVTSDWLLEDRGTWNGYQRFIDGVNIYPILPGKPLLVHAKTDRIPYMAQWSQQLFVVFFAAVPLALHKAWATLTAFILYMVVYALTVIHEVWGYSGIRVHGIVPSPIAWLLRVFNAELALEDHDLHHRRRWKKSFNYGKQTRDVGSTVWHVCREVG